MTSIPTNQGTKTPEEIVDELTYRSFRHNVLKNPKISIQRWTAVFGNQTHAFAKRLQSETQKN